MGKKEGRYLKRLTEESIQFKMGKDMFDLSLLIHYSVF